MTGTGRILPWIRTNCRPYPIFMIVGAEWWVYIKWLQGITPQLLVIYIACMITKIIYGKYVIE